MIIFTTIALAAFLVIAGSFLSGHDHEVGDDCGDHSIDSHDLGEATISIFSVKVIGSLFMGFGAAGGIAMHYGTGYLAASLLGVVSGIVLATLTYLVISLFYRQQASSLVPTRSAVGRTGSVTVSIGENTPGEVGLYLEGEYRTFSASSSDGRPLSKGETVLVLNNIGSHLVVEKGL